MVGNGRCARLFCDTYLKKAKLYISFDEVSVLFAYSKENNYINACLYNHLLTRFLRKQSGIYIGSRLN